MQLLLLDRLHVLLRRHRARVAHLHEHSAAELAQLAEVRLPVQIHHVRQVPRAEDLAAVPAVVLALQEREPRVALGAIRPLSIGHPVHPGRLSRGVTVAAALAPRIRRASAQQLVEPLLVRAVYRRGVRVHAPAGAVALAVEPVTL